MAGKSPYTAEQKARVYTELLASDGNVKRVARETGITATTVRRWKAEFAENPPAPETVAQVSGEWLDDAKRVRSKAVLEIERQIDAHEMKGAALVTTVGVLDDKIMRVEGVTSKSRVDHVHHLPSAEEARALLGGLLTGAIDAGRVRQAELVEAEITEQAEDAEFKALPSPSNS